MTHNYREYFVRDRVTRLLYTAREVAPLLGDDFHFANIVVTDKCVGPDGHPTMGVDDGWVLYVHSGVFERWSDREVVGIILHEISHLALRHHERVGTRDKILWNKAADATINGDWRRYFYSNCKRSKAEIPKCGIFPETLDQEEGMAVEERYDLLLNEPDEWGPGLPSPGSGEDGENDPNSEGGDLEGEPDNAESGDGNGQGEGQTDDDSYGQGGSSTQGGSQDRSDESMRGLPEFGGSCSDGQQRPWEISKSSDDYPGYDCVSKHRAEENLRTAIKAAGLLPGFLSRCNTFKSSTGRIGWSVLANKLKAGIRGSLRKRGLGSLTYSKLNRRQCFYKDIRLPGMASKDIKLGVVLDTSGSMDQHCLKRALEEIDKISASLGRMRLYVACTDVRSYGVQEVRKASEIELVGGGGTDLRPGITCLDEFGVNVIVTITDGFVTSWRMDKPRAKHFTVLVGPGKIPADQCDAVALGPVFSVGD